MDRSNVLGSPGKVREGIIKPRDVPRGDDLPLGFLESKLVVTQVLSIIHGKLCQPSMRRPDHEKQVYTHFTPRQKQENPLPERVFFTFLISSLWLLVLFQ